MLENLIEFNDLRIFPISRFLIVNESLVNLKAISLNRTVKIYAKNFMHKDDITQEYFVYLNDSHSFKFKDNSKIKIYLNSAVIRFFKIWIEQSKQTQVFKFILISLELC